MAFADSNNKIFENVVNTTDGKNLTFQLLENKRSGQISLSIREFKSAKKPGDYEGPTKNGIITKLESVEQIDMLQKAFNEYFDEVKKHI